MFRWARWDSQTEDSVWWAVLCALILSVIILIVLKLPVLIPLLLIVVPISLIIFTYLGWIEQGNKADKSWSNILRFFRSFYTAIMVPTVGYTAVGILAFAAVALRETFY